MTTQCLEFGMPPIFLCPLPYLQEASSLPHSQERFSALRDKNSKRQKAKATSRLAMPSLLLKLYPLAQGHTQVLSHLPGAWVCALQKCSEWWERRKPCSCQFCLPSHTLRSCEAGPHLVSLHPFFIPSQNSSYLYMVNGRSCQTEVCIPSLNLIWLCFTLRQGSL